VQKHCQVQLRGIQHSQVQGRGCLGSATTTGIWVDQASASAHTGQHNVQIMNQTRVRQLGSLHRGQSPGDTGVPTFTL
jgi:hypothetical protein